MISRRKLLEMASGTVAGVAGAPFINTSNAIAFQTGFNDSQHLTREEAFRLSADISRKYNGLLVVGTSYGNIR